MNRILFVVIIALCLEAAVFGADAKSRAKPDPKKDESGVSTTTAVGIGVGGLALGGGATALIYRSRLGRVRAEAASCKANYRNLNANLEGRVEDLSSDLADARHNAKKLETDNNALRKEIERMKRAEERRRKDEESLYETEYRPERDREEQEKEDKLDDFEAYIRRAAQGEFEDEEGASPKRTSESKPNLSATESADDESRPIEATKRFKMKANVDPTEPLARVDSRRVHTRWMIRRDMPEVLEIEKATYESDWNENTFVKYLRERNTIGLVAEENDKVLGYIVYELSKDTLRIVNIGSVLGKRRAQVERSLIEKLKSKLASHRRTKLQIELPPNEKGLIARFEGYGFTRRKQPLLNWYPDGKPAVALVIELADNGVAQETIPRPVGGN